MRSEVRRQARGESGQQLYPAGDSEAMRTPLRGRPKLDIPLEEILEAVRATGNQTQAAMNLGCSEASVRKQIKQAGLTLAQVLASEDVEG